MLIVLVTYVQGHKHSWNMKFAVLYIIYIYIYMHTRVTDIYCIFLRIQCAAEENKVCIYTPSFVIYVQLFFFCILFNMNPE